MNRFFRLLLFIWQLPQNLIGLAVLLVVSGRRSIVYNNLTKDIEVVSVSNLFGSAVSLGRYIIIDELYTKRDPKVLERCIAHETGHTRQSKYLGPLYLLLVGLPSLTGNLTFRLLKKAKPQNNAKYSMDYYKQPWEAWADRLGGVVRE